MGRRVLVTGGLGFIGRALSEALIKHGDEIRILDDRSRGNERFLGVPADNFEIVHGDIRDETVVTKAVRGCEQVYHLAAINGTKNFYERPKEVLEVGILGTLRVIQAVIEQDVEEFLFMSSSETYQTPPTVPTDESVRLCVPDVTNPRYSYGGGKLAGELMTMHYGREEMNHAVIVRPHNVYGPHMGYDHVIPELTRRIFEKHRKRGDETFTVPLQGDGSATRAFVYIDDFIDGVLLAMDKGKHLDIFHVGTEEEISILALGGRIARHLGCRVTFKTSAAPMGQTPRRCPDISKLKSLGYRPRIDIDQGLSMVLPSIIQEVKKGAF